jgi:hypothetical protein
MVFSPKFCVERRSDTAGQIPRQNKTGRTNADESVVENAIPESTALSRNFCGRDKKTDAQSSLRFRESHWGNAGGIDPSYTPIFETCPWIRAHFTDFSTVQISANEKASREIFISSKGLVFD